MKFVGICAGVICTFVVVGVFVSGNTEVSQWDGPEGTWHYDAGRIHLTVEGNSVSGTYGGGDLYDVALDRGNRTVTGTWLQWGSAQSCPHMVSGRWYWGIFHWTFNEQWTEFEGTSIYCTDQSTTREWNGSRIEE